MKTNTLVAIFAGMLVSGAVFANNADQGGGARAGGAYVMATGGFAFQSELLGPDYTISVGAYPISGGGVDFPAEAFKLGNGYAAIVSSRMSLRIGPSIAYQT